MQWPNRWRSEPRPWRLIWAPSLVRRVIRSRSFVIGLSVVTVAAASMAVEGRWSEADAARAAWGGSEPVLRLVADVGAGEAVAPATELDTVPSALVPEGALAEVPDGALAAVDLVAGEIVLDARVIGAGPASLPTGTVAVSVIAVATTHLQDGDLVDLWVTDASTLTSRLVVPRVLVLDIDDDLVTVAVAAASVADVVTAALRPLTLVRHG